MSETGKDAIVRSSQTTSSRREAPARSSFRTRLARWIVLSIVYFGVSLAVVLWVLPPRWTKLGWYVLYMSISNAILPLAVNPPTMVAGALYPPWLVALLGALATGWANQSEYLLLGPVFAHRHADRVRASGIYQSLLRRFQGAPPLCIVIGTFLPLPVDVIRLVAIASGYPALRYLGFDITGRFFRYFLLATLGEVFHGSDTMLTILFLIVLCLPPLISAASRLLIRRSKQREAAGRPLH